VVGYFEEEVVISYTQYFREIDEGRHENVDAPRVAIDYRGLSPTAKLRDMVITVREDEAGHRDRNHDFADILKRGDAPTSVGPSVMS